MIAAVLMILGSVLMLLAAVGLLRLPDAYLRMSAASKAATLGIALLLVGAAVHFGTAAVVLRALVVVAFFILTAPLAAHRIGRAGYRCGTPLWEGTQVDELEAAERGRAAGPRAGRAGSSGEAGGDS